MGSLTEIGTLECVGPWLRRVPFSHSLNADAATATLLISLQAQSIIYIQNHGLHKKGNCTQKHSFSTGKYLHGNDNILVPHDADFSLLGKVNIIYLRRYNAASCFLFTVIYNQQLNATLKYRWVVLIQRLSQTEIHEGVFLTWPNGSFSTGS